MDVRHEIVTVELSIPKVSTTVELSLKNKLKLPTPAVIDSLNSIVKFEFIATPPAPFEGVND